MMIVKRKRKDRKKSVDDVPSSSLPVIADGPEASSDWLIRSPIHQHTALTKATVSENNANNNGIGGGGKRKLYKRLHSEEANSSNKSGLLKKTKQKGSLDSFSGFVKRHSFDSAAASSNKTSFSNGPTENADRFPAEYPEPEHLSERRTSAHRVSYRKAIQKAGYNMNELVSATTAGFSTNVQQRSIQKTELDWTESAVPDDHLWAPTNASGDLCYVGEQNCHKSGPRKKCSACHIVVHDACYSQLVRIGFQCKTTFREATSRTMRESMVVHHHWVHRRKQEGKCKHCGKSFEKRFGFREPTKIVAISCSWCKETFHNKVGCFQMHKINEPCSMGDFARSIVPPTWITKASQKQKSLRNRSKKKRGSGGTWRKKSSRDNRQKTFSVRPMPHQAAFVSPTLVFINPKSGGNQGAKLMQAFQWAINPRQIFDLSKGGPQEGLELYRKVPNLRILACGGDGTVGWILSVIDKMNLARPPPVAILPLGTGNDLSRTLNFGPGYSDEPIHKILHGVEEAKLAKLDRWKLRVEKNEQAVVTLRHEDADDNSLSNEEPQITGVDKPPLDVVNNYFSIGSDAQVTLSFHESREAHPSKFNSRIGNKMYYMRRGVYEYVNRQQKDLSKHITVVCDGVNITPKIRDLKPVCIVFLNIQRYSAGTSPWGHPTGTEFTAQRHDDKLIEVLAFSLNQLGMIFVGGHGDRLCQCKEAYIRTYKTFPVQIDGEPCRLNPSNIKFEFFNQANVLSKSKRRPSTAMEPNQHEQIKIRLNMVSNQDFDEQFGSKAKLVTKATPFLVTVAMSNSTLDVLRMCLDNHNASDKGDSNSDRWFFLDSSDEDKFYRIDRSQENLHLVCDVITAERELYILEFQDPLTPPILFPVRTRGIDRKSIQFRGRVQSDSGLQAYSFEFVKNHSYSDEALVDLSEVAKKISTSRQTNSLDEESPRRQKPAPGSPQVVNSHTSSSPLDVVFEQADDNNNHDVSEAFEPIFEKTPSQSVAPDDDYDVIEEPKTPVEKAKVTPKEKDEKSKLPETCSSWSSVTTSPVARSRGNTYESDSSYSTSSNEYVIHDDVLPRNRNASLMTQRAVSPSKSPLRPAHSTPPAYKGQLLGAYVNQLDESGRKDNNKKKHRRSNTDTDPKKALSGGQMLLSNFVKTMKLSGHNNNNNNNKSNNNNNNSNNNNNRNSLDKESCRSCGDVSRHCTRHDTHNDASRRHSVGGQPLPQLERFAKNKKATSNPPNEKDQSWNRVLLDAAMRGDEEETRRAVGEGADLLATDEEGRNALHCACSFTHLGIVRFLIKKMPTMVNVTDQLRQSGLHKAALAGALDVCEELVEAGATIGLVDCMGKSVLDRAKQVDSPRLVSYLRTVQSSKVKAAMISSPETHI